MVFRCPTCKKSFISGRGQRSHLKQNLICAAAFDKEIARRISLNISPSLQPFDATSLSAVEEPYSYPHSPINEPISNASLHAPPFVKHYPEHAEAGHIYDAGQTRWEMAHDN